MINEAIPIQIGRKSEGSNSSTEYSGAVFSVFNSESTRESQSELNLVESPVPPSSPVTGWDPFAEMDRMQQQIDRWMQGAPFGFSQMPRNNFLGTAAAQPDIRIEEDSDVYRVRVTVPEGSELELNTEVDEKRLTVSGAVSTNLDESNRRFFSSSQFSRQFTLDSPVDSLGMRKEARDNEIIITLPKA